MLLNYLKIAVRNIQRSASYTLINVLGLALGIACALLIFSVVYYHLHFDDFHHNSDRVYRFVTEQHRGDNVSYDQSVPPAFGKAFRDDYTFGEKVARLCIADESIITVGDGVNVKKFQEEVSFADPEFFGIFNFPLISGNQKEIMVAPSTAVITERIARKYFGNEPAVGKTLRFNNQADFTITGVLAPIPDNTDFRSEIYLSYNAIKIYSDWYAQDDAWGGITTDIQTFTRLRPGTTPAEVEAVLPNYVKKYRAKSRNVHHYLLQPLSDIHLNATYSGRIGTGVLIVLSVIGLFLIFTACLNFINLATAQTMGRTREVGVRKTLGSARSQLFWQFTSETAVIVLIAGIIAFCTSYAALPLINEFSSSRITLNLFADPTLAAFFITLLVAVTMMSSFYPGLILSGFKPALALKGKLTSAASGKINIRRSLIITQFVISQVLLIGLIVIVHQMKYFRQSDMGFDRDAIVMIPVGSHDQKAETLKKQFLQMPNVETASLCFAAPASQSSWTTSFYFDNRQEAEVFSVSFRGADEDYLSTFNIELLAGRNITPTDSSTQFVINETLVKKLNQTPEEILGKTMAANGGQWKGPIVGVIKDFHDQSFREDIRPLFITVAPENHHNYAVKINMSDSRTTLASLEKAWTEMYPENIFQYQFVDDQIAEFYSLEESMLTLVQVFALIALFIACMGLYGLVSFMAMQKTKEIGIRKVLGGSVSQILWIFGKEFSRLVFIAFVIAAPLAYLLMSEWLENYPYRDDLSIWIFVVELAFVFAIVLLTVGYQSLRAATANPVNSLRAE